MNEFPPNQFEEEEKERKKKEFIALAQGLSEKREGFPFPGIDPGSYAELKAIEEEFPGFATPIDELIKKFESTGFKVVFGEHGERGDIFVLPSSSNDIENDGLFPRHLNISDDMDEALKRLILARKK